MRFDPIRCPTAHCIVLCACPETQPRRAQVAAHSPETIDSLIGTLTNVRAGGTETVNGDRARIYEYDSAQEVMGMKSTGAHKLWVRESDGLPVNLYAETDMDGLKSSTESMVEYDTNSQG